MNSPAPARLGAILDREHEVEQVRAALRAVEGRAGGVLVVEGAAGIGKSRLVVEDAHGQRIWASAFWRTFS